MAAGRLGLIGKEMLFLSAVVIGKNTILLFVYKICIFIRFNIISLDKIRLEQTSQTKVFEIGNKIFRN